MKVFLYIRVACADQLAEADQREELERYAKDKGYEVAAAVAADGISGVHTEGIMNFLLNEAKSGHRYDPHPRHLANQPGHFLFHEV